MVPISYPVLCMVAICAYAGIYHFALYIRRRADKTNIAFSLLCFFVAYYQVSCIGLYNAPDFKWGIFWQQFNFSGMGLIGIGVSWFIYYFTNQKDKRAFVAISSVFVFFVIVSFLPGRYTLSPSACSPITISFGNNVIQYFESKPGLLLSLEMLFCNGVLFFFSGILAKHYFRHRDRNAGLILASFVFFYVLSTFDVLTALRVLRMIYLTEYAYMLIVFSMAVAMTNRFVLLHTTIEELNKDLEKKVLRRTEELQTAMAEMERINRELTSTRDELQVLNETLEKLATVDDLTSLANHRKFQEFLMQEWRRSVRHAKCISLVFIDVDFFKEYNDSYGHQEGDNCLIKIARTLQSIALRPTDIVARYGGEEFVIVLGDTDSAGAMHVAERARRAIAELNIPHKKSTAAGHVTISLGVATILPVKNEKPLPLIQAADEALYRSKNGGRNRVTFISC